MSKWHNLAKVVHTDKYVNDNYEWHNLGKVVHRDKYVNDS